MDIQCPNSSISFSYSRFNTNSEDDDCKVIPTSTLTSAFDSNSYKIEDLDISFLTCGSTGFLNANQSQSFEVKGNFICIPQSLVTENQTFVFWAHV